MGNKRRPKGYWDIFENCKKEIELYSSIKEFRESNSGARRKIKLNGWEFLYEFYEHRNFPNTWTKQKCADIAKDCTNVRDFRKISEVAYRKTIGNDWFDEICNHFDPLGNKTLRMIYFVDFGNGIGYVGLTCDFKQRMKEHLSYGPVYRYHIETGITPKFYEVTGYTDKKEAQKNESYYEKQYKELGYTLLNTAKTGALGSDVKWTYDACELEAKKYNSRVDYQKNSGSSYDRARKEGWLNNICKHMDYLCVPSDYYTEEDIFNIAKKYKTFKEFRTKEDAAYRFSIKLKIKEQIKSLLTVQWSKKQVLNLETGIYYDSVMEASIAHGVKYDNLKVWLRTNSKKNTTSLISVL